MRLKLVEPLRELFKDEVRAVGRQLGLTRNSSCGNHFPARVWPVRILGDITPARLDLLRRADAIVAEEVRREGWYTRLWQSFAVLLPIQSVGVMGDARTYENTGRHSSRRKPGWHDSRLGPSALRSSSPRLEPDCQRGPRESIASFTTSARSLHRRLNGNSREVSRE